MTPAKFWPKRAFPTFLRKQIKTKYPETSGCSCQFLCSCRLRWHHSWIHSWIHSPAGHSHNPTTAPLQITQSPGAGDSGMCPGGFGMCPEKETPPLPWAAAPGLCHPPQQEFLSHAGGTPCVIIYGHCSLACSEKSLTPSSDPAWKYSYTLMGSPLSLPFSRPTRPSPAVSPHMKDAPAPCSHHLKLFIATLHELFGVET